MSGQVTKRYIPLLDGGWASVRDGGYYFTSPVPTRIGDDAVIVPIGGKRTKVRLLQSFKGHAYLVERK